MIRGNWPSGPKEAVLTVNGHVVNDDIITITYTDDLCGGGSAMVIGAAAAARLRLVIDHPSVPYNGAALTVMVGGVPLGCFAVTEATEKDGRLTLDAVDALGTSAMRQAYAPSASSGTALSVVREICAAAGLTLGDVSGIADVPVEGLKAGATRLEMLGAMAAILGRNAHIDRTGALVLRWYAAFDYGVTAGEVYAGDPSKKLADVTLGRIECTAETTTVNVVTDDQGRTTTTEESETQTLTAGSGETGITLQCDYMTQNILDGIYARIGGFTYRPMTLSFYGDCRVETGDVLQVTERDGTTRSVPVSSVVHSWDGGVRTTVTAAGAQEGTDAAGPMSSAVAQLGGELNRFRNQDAQNVAVLNARIAQERAAREDAIAALARSLAVSDGMYETTETPSGGGTIYYLHDKPALADSRVVLKLTGQALGISTDGGRTYPAGWNFVTGDTITSVLSAVGVNADWINAGSILAQLIRLNGKMEVYTDENLAQMGGYIGYMSGQDQSGGTTSGIALKSSDEDHYIIVTTDGVRLTEEAPGEVRQAYLANGYFRLSNAGLIVDATKQTVVKSPGVFLNAASWGSGGTTYSGTTHVNNLYVHGNIMAEDKSSGAAGADGVTIDSRSVLVMGGICFAAIEFTVSSAVGWWGNVIAGLPAARIKHYFLACRRSDVHSEANTRILYMDAGSTNIAVQGTLEAGTSWSCYASYPVA